MDPKRETPPVVSKDETSVSHEATSLPYTVFTISQRRWLTYLLGYLTLASSLTATIYFPLIGLLSVQYNVSIQAINLSITLYVIFQAISPAFCAPISDTLGRRPVFLLTFFIYVAASLGLAFNKTSYAALLLLRGLQSIGGSAVMSLAYGVVADISLHSERGKILGPMLTSTNLGPCVGPVISGGAILASGDTQWCFWALLIFGASSLMLVGWTMPETARTVVGNGAVPARGLWRTWWSLLRLSAPRELSLNKRTQDETRVVPHLSKSSAANNINAGKTGRGKLIVPRPLASLRIIFYCDTFLILWMAASSYAIWYCIQTSIPLIYGKEYGFNDLIVGLCFLPGGSGVIFGGLIAGRLMDWNYVHTAKEAGLPVDRVGGDDIRQFPIEKARSRGSFTMLVISICALTGYGWAVERHVHPSVPLILQFFIGVKCTIILQMFSALLVDIFPDTPGTAAAANNVTRCALSAAIVAVLQPLVDAIGRAWFFTLIGLVDGVAGLLAVWLLQRWGRKWRQMRESVSF
jgi:MFS family permease